MTKTPVREKRTGYFLPQNPATVRSFLTIILSVFLLSFSAFPYCHSERLPTVILSVAKNPIIIYHNTDSRSIGERGQTPQKAGRKPRKFQPPFTPMSTM